METRNWDMGVAVAGGRKRLTECGNERYPAIKGKLSILSIFPQNMRRKCYFTISINFRKFPIKKGYT